MPLAFTWNGPLVGYPLPRNGLLTFIFTLGELSTLQTCRCYPRRASCSFHTGCIFKPGAL